MLDFQERKIHPEACGKRFSLIHRLKHPWFHDYTIDSGGDQHIHQFASKRSADGFIACLPICWKI